MFYNNYTIFRISDPGIMRTLFSFQGANVYVKRVHGGIRNNQFIRYSIR